MLFRSRVGERLRKAPLIEDILGASEYAGRQFDETDIGKSTRKVRDRVSNIREDALEVWETSQNPWVYRFASAYDGLTGETEQGQAIKELRRLDPAWDLAEWIEEIQDEIAPNLLRGYLEGDDEIVDYYCVDAASAIIKATVKDNRENGKIPDPTILDLRGVELMAARVLQRAPPILVVKFNAQHLDCIRNKKGEVIHGTEDAILPLDHGIALADGIKNSTRMIMDRVGHEIPEQLYSEIVNAIVENIKRAY